LFWSFCHLTNITLYTKQKFINLVHIRFLFPDDPFVFGPHCTIHTNLSHLSSVW
jgi:hypothetical protein